MQSVSEAELSANATLTSTMTKQVWVRPPVDVDFQVLTFAASGVYVKFLRVAEKGDYRSVKWVKYMTKASGSYQVRVSGFVLSLENEGWDCTDQCFWCSSEAPKTWAIIHSGDLIRYDV